MKYTEDKFLHQVGLVFLYTNITFSHFSLYMLCVYLAFNLNAEFFIGLVIFS